MITLEDIDAISPVRVSDASLAAFKSFIEQLEDCRDDSRSYSGDEDTNG